MQTINDAKQEFQLSVIDFLRQNYGDLPAAKKEFTLIAAHHLTRVYGIDHPGETVDIPHISLQVALAHHLRKEVNAIPNMRHQLVFLIKQYLKREAHRSTGDRLIMTFVALHNLDKIARGVHVEEYFADLFTIYKNCKATQHNRMGNEFYEAELYEESIDEYSSAVVLDPLNTLYLCNRATSFRLLKNYYSAVIDSKTAIGMDGNCVKAYSNLGMTYMKQDMLKESINAFKAALILDPHNSTFKDSIKSLESRLVYKQSIGSNMRLTARKTESDSKLMDEPSTSKYSGRRTESDSKLMDAPSTSKSSGRRSPF